MPHLKDSEAVRTASSAKSAQSPFHIAICGGGIGGLAVAIGLIKEGISVTIYEQSPSFREIGAGIGFGKNSMTAMRLIDPALYEGFMSIATNNGSEAHDTWFDFYSGMSVGGVDAGTYMSTVKVDGESAQCMASRADLLDEMVKLIPSGTAHFNKRVVFLNQDHPDRVVIIFADGSNAEADAVIGCDGVRSATRDVVLQSQAAKIAPVFTSKYAYRGLIPMDQAIEALGKSAAINRRMYLGHHGHLLCFPVAQGKMMNVVAFKDKPDGVWDRPTWVEPTTKDEMCQDFDGFSPTVHKILKLMLKPDKWAIFDLPSVPIFFRERICLLGDSAHASSPHFGAGAGMAMEDAYVLSNILGACESRHGLSNAFAAYDAIRRPRTHRVTEASRAQGKFLDLEEPELWSKHKLNLDIIDKRLNQNVQFIWAEDLPGEVVLAEGIFKQSEAIRNNRGNGVPPVDD